jgi:hypothetical protein
MNKIYNIILDDNKIGTTQLEKADVPMGIVFGQINFVNINSGYDFFKNYCQAKNIEIITNYPIDKLIATADIPNLKVFDNSGVEIKGVGTNVSGMDSDTFEITVLGISYPFYQEEFPHHVNAYNEMF